MTLMPTTPLGNPAASSELRLSVELGPTATVTTWLLARGFVAAEPLEVSKATVPLERLEAPACDANTPTKTDETTSTAPSSCRASGTTRPVRLRPGPACPGPVAAGPSSVVVVSIPLILPYRRAFLSSPAQQISVFLRTPVTDTEGCPAI